LATNIVLLDLPSSMPSQTAQPAIFQKAHK
jgi:hypothetical protein